MTLLSQHPRRPSAVETEAQFRESTPRAAARIPPSPPLPATRADDRGTNRAVVHFYNGRGTAEQWIKEGKAPTHWTRLSCHRFRANEVRLLLGVIAYNLRNLLRRLTLPLAIQNWSLTSLQQRVFKTGGRLIRHARYFTLQLAESYLTGPLFRQILGRIERFAWHPT